MQDSARPGETPSAAVADGQTTSPGLDLLSVIDGPSEGFALLDSNFIILEINVEVLRQESRKRDELIGRSHWEAYPEYENSELGALYKQAMRDRVHVSLEHRHRREDGRFACHDVRAYPVEGDRLAIFFRDVTDRHEAERKLRESEQRFHAAVDAFVDALWTNDASGRMTGEQPGWAALTGQTYAEYLDFGWSNAVHPDDAQPTIDAWNAAVAEQQPFAFEHRVRTRSGDWRRFAVRAVPILDEDGSVREWVGVHRDVTDTTEKRLLLARNAATFKSLVTDNPFGVYVIDQDFKLLHVSQGSGKVFAGIEPLTGRDFAEVLRLVWQKPFASEAIGHFRNTLATGQNFISLRMIETRQNIDALESYDWRIDRIALPDGQFGVVCYFYDLSERVDLETSLRKALDDKDILLREIDHRVRNSLSMVSALLATQGNAAQSEDIRHALSIAAARIQAIARIHERLYKGKQFGVVQFDEYLAQICNDLHASLACDGARLAYEAVPLQLAVDHAIPLGLITNELVTNAFKHSRGKDVTIRVTLAEDSGEYILSVKDNGDGMAANFATKPEAGLGMKVIGLLTRQIGAKMNFPAPGHPAEFKLLIPARLIVAPNDD